MKRDTHFDTKSQSFGRSPKLIRFCASFFCRSLEVGLIEEGSDVDAREDCIRAHRAPEQERVFEPVDAAVFRQDLIKRGYGYEEDDRVD